jgi:hypothetical protein
MSSFITKNITFREIFEVFKEVMEEYKDYNKSTQELYFIFRTRLHERYNIDDNEEMKFNEFFEKYLDSFHK